MKHIIKHITLTIATILMVLVSTAQIKTRYVEIGSIHALSINENTDYRFDWSIQTPSAGMITVSSKTARTENITWDEQGRYHVTVVPLLDSVDCYGENVKMDVVTVDFLSLHTFDDVFYTTPDTPLEADVSGNDFDDRGYAINYNPQLVQLPSNGTAIMGIDGVFSYTPDPGFTGIDEFVYEAFVREGSDNEMYSNSKVTIVVQDDQRQSDLYIEKTGPEKALFGQTIHYQIKLVNNGPHVAQNVMLKDTLGFGLFEAQYRFGNTPTYLPWNDSLVFETMGIRDTINLNIRAVISNNAPNMVYNQAISWSDTFDPNYVDNDSIWPVEISSIYADLPGQVHVPSCETYILPGDSSDANVEIESYRWSPSDGLSDSTIANPVFTPDSSTYGKNIKYILTITDENGNEAQDTIELLVAKQPEAIIEADTLYKDLGVDIVIDASDSKGEELGLSYDWSTTDGQIESNPYADTITVSSVGIYYLELIDRFGCTSNDSVVVLLQSYPPVVINDSVSIVAGDSTVLPGFGAEYLALAANPAQQFDYLQTLPDSNLNVLYNDYDLNDFDIELTEIITPPSSGLVSYRWDSAGQIVIMPDSSFWGIDSMQYRVCNTGVPVKCDSGWVYIHSLRPPRSADVQIVKTADNIKTSDGQDIAFWGDTIRYSLQIINNGPDTIMSLAVTDRINSGLLNPEFSFDKTGPWQQWPLSDQYNYAEYLIPGIDTLTIHLKAYVRDEAQRFITNTAYIETEIIENDLWNDTSRVTTKIKNMVKADAGRDTLLGACVENLVLDGSASMGEDISFHWSPLSPQTNHLADFDTSTPTFVNPGESGNYSYVLEITDNDNITVTDTITITVLPPPVARTVRDYYEIPEGDTIGLDGGASTLAQYIVSYNWKVIDGNIVSGTENQKVVAVGSTGEYRLIVTDIAGCMDSTDVMVYPFYYAPVAIPDYYSTELGKELEGDLRYNDFDPNERFFNENFELKVVPATFTTDKGARVTINEDGEFTLDPRSVRDVVSFTYELYNVDLIHNGRPYKKTRGYARVTINRDNDIAHLKIDKQAENSNVLIGERHAAEFKITIENEGPVDADEVLLTDSLPMYFRDAEYSIGNSTLYTPFHGTLDIPNGIDNGENVVINIRATVSGGAPKYLFNAAMSSSPIYDDQFDWDDISIRNVDTVSVVTESNLFANAELVELFDDNDDDATIGRCDEKSYLTAENSSPKEGINGWSWSPAEYLISPDSSRTKFNFANLPDRDTTITFNLSVQVDNEYAFDNVNVRFSPKVIADAGPDLKMNEDDEIIYVDQAFAQGAEIEIEWVKIVNGEYLEVEDFKDDNPLQPIITKMGRYGMKVTDKHGCYDWGYITVKENSLYLVNDIINVVRGDTIVGNVSTNDFDPDGDSIYYTGVVDDESLKGSLMEYPMSSGIEKSALAENRIGSDGSFVYIAPDDFVGYTYFSYEGCDNNQPVNMCKEGIVHIHVVDIDDSNTPPVVNPDYLFANIGDTIRTNILANDYDPDGGEITVEDIIEGPEKGELIYQDGEGRIVYVPYITAIGTDRFVYQVCDNGTTEGCNTAEVIIDIHKIADENHQPVAGDDAYFAVEKAITGNILDNDYDPDGDIISLINDSIEGPYHAESFKLNRDGSFTYTPKPGFEGVDQIVYKIQESYRNPSMSDMATIYILSLSEERYNTDVMITKTAVKEMLSGQFIVYDLKVKVNGPTLANDILFIDELDSVLNNAQYSIDNGQTWSEWSGEFYVEQMMLFGERTIKVRGRIPDVYAGDLLNTACVEHDMGEINEDDNCSEISTGIYQRVIADAGRDTTIGYCSLDEDFVLDASNSIGMSTLEYFWISEDVDIMNPDSETTSITADPGSINEIMLVVSSSVSGFTSDSDTAYINVTVARETKAWAGNDVWPETADPVMLDGSSSKGPEGGLDYSWYIYDNDDNVVVLGETATLEVNRTNDYYLEVVDKYGCTSIDMVHVGYPVDPYEAIDDQDSTYQQEEIVINVLENDLIDDDDEYEFDLLIILDYPEHGELVVNSYDSTVTYIPEPYYFGPDTFVYQMSTVNNFTDNATVMINVLQKLPVIPDGFSPNGDGINDKFEIENIDLYPDNSLIIFNRWGNVIYKKSPYTEDKAEVWDGIANEGIRVGSGVVPTGVYLYILDLGDDERLSQKVYKGNLYIASDNRR